MDGQNYGLRDFLRPKEEVKKAAEAAEAADAKASDEDWTTGLSGFLPILDGITTASAVGYLRRKNGMIQSYHRFFCERWTWMFLVLKCKNMTPDPWLIPPK